MSFIKRQNVFRTAASGPGDILFALKEDMVTSGLWSVVASGDGSSSYEFSGVTGGAGTGSGGQWDVWEVEADANRATAWCLVQDGAGRQLLIRSRLTTGNFCRFTLLWSHDGSYTNTGASATAIPNAAADEQAIINTRASEAEIFDGGGGDVYWSMFVENELQNTVGCFNIFLWTTTSNPTSSVGLFPIVDTPSYENAPYMFLEQVGTTGLDSKSWEAKGNAGERWHVQSQFYNSQVLRSFPPFYGGTGAFTHPYLTDLLVVAATGTATEAYFRGRLYGIKGNTDRDGNIDFPNISNISPDGITWAFWEYTSFFWDDTLSPPVPSGSITPSTETVEHLSFGASFTGELGGETVPPVVTVNTPAGKLASKTASLSFDVTDDVEIASSTVLVKFASLGTTECAYHNGTFRAPYTNSTLVGDTFTLTRDGGWPADFDLDVTAVDTSGNISV